MKTDFKIGDRVVVIEEMKPFKILGKTAVILGINERWGWGEEMLDLVFTEDVGGHDLDGLVETGYGLHVYSSNVKLYQPINLQQFKNTLEETLMNLKDIEEVLEDTQLVPCLCRSSDSRAITCKGCEAYTLLHEALPSVEFLLEQVESTLKKRSVNNGNLN